MYQLANACRTEIFSTQSDPLAEASLPAVGGIELLRLSLADKSRSGATGGTDADLAGGGGFRSSCLVAGDRRFGQARILGDDVVGRS